MEVFGWIGFVLIQTFYIPQTVKILKSRDVSGLALPSWIILATALACLLVYSISRHDPVFMAGNSMGVVQSSIMVGLILKYRKRSEKA
ncbi:SemiSWEET family sugar transporter [Chloroflexota bacterium]